MKNGFNGEILHILSRTQVYFLLVRSFSEEFSRFALICPTRLMGDCFPHASLPLRGLRNSASNDTNTANFLRDIRENSMQKRIEPYCR